MLPLGAKISFVYTDKPRLGFVEQYEVGRFVKLANLPVGGVEPPRPYSTFSLDKIQGEVIIEGGESYPPEVL